MHLHVGAGADDEQGDREEGSEVEERRHLAERRDHELGLLASELGFLRHCRAMVKKEDTVTLISAEGFEFIIDRRAALVSTTLKNMLTSAGSFTETVLGEVKLQEISTSVLEKVCQYFYWSLQFASGKESEFHIEPEITLELMMAANFLDT